jgi:hypothetical protein
MALDADTVDRALTCDAEWLAGLRRDWLALADLAVWGGAQSSRLGALPKLRKRIIELGERLAGLAAPRGWIPQPRERLKSALATAIASGELLEQCGRLIAELDAGAARDELDAALAALSRRTRARLDEQAARWAELLDSQLAPDKEE